MLAEECCASEVKLVMIDRRGHFPSRMASEGCHVAGGITPGVRRLGEAKPGEDAHPDPRTLLAVIWIVDQRDLPRSYPVGPW